MILIRKADKTNLNEPLRYLTNAIKKRCTAFIISDFIVPDFEEALRIASNKHDVVALKVYDPVEKAIPDIGMIKVLILNQEKRNGLIPLPEMQGKNMRSGGNDHIDLIKIYSRDVVWIQLKLSTDEDYVKPLIKLFKNR